MSQQELLKRVVETLEGAGVPYMITGSLASSLQGAPRSTHDIGVIVELSAAALPMLLAAFPPSRYYLDELSARQAIDRSDMFNLLDADTGYKVDFWMVKSDEFNRCRFARRIAGRMGGVPVQVSSPEDTILQKLKWSVECGGSEKQMNDVLGVYEVQAGQLDHAYLDDWTAKLGVADLLAQIRGRANPI